MSAFVRAERREIGWEDLYGSGPIRPYSGGRTQALRLAACYAAVSLVADMFSTLPQHVYESTPTSRRKIATPPWLARPAPGLSPIEWRYQYSTSLQLRGNAYGLVISERGRVQGIAWLHPDTVDVIGTAEGPRYYLADGSEERPYSQGGRIIHVREFIEPGSVKGLSPIRNFARDIELGHNAAEFGRRFFEAGGIPTALLMNKAKTLSEDQAREAKRLWVASVAEGGIVTVPGDWDYKKLSIDPAEAQFLATIKANATIIGVIFRVPPEDIGGEVGSSRSYGNREADAERFNVRKMLPHVARYEQAVGEVLPETQFVKLSMDALTRPNLIDRVKVTTEQLRNGTLTLAEARALEDREPLTTEQIAEWQQWYTTTKSESESVAESIATSITKEV